MTNQKLDYKKEYKDLYLPKRKPELIDVPNINFIMVDGKGAPGGEVYQNAIAVLYGISFTIKMSKLGKNPIKGYFDYVTPPLEGLWWWDDKYGGSMPAREEWLWTSMIRLPEFVTKDVFEWALKECQMKKPELDYSSVRFESFTEGLCVQMMHIGPFSEEPKTVALIEQYIEENNLINLVGGVYKHHEIYLNDPRKVNPDKMKTVLRYPVKRKD